MIQGGMILNYIKPAMVIGKDKTFGRYHFACTKTSETDNRILQASAVKIINVFGADFHAQAFHFLFIQFFQQLGKPHSFIGKRNQAYKKYEQERKKGSF